MKTVLLVFFQWITLSAFAQPDMSKISDSIVNEAKKIYRSEHASWYGTDLFVQEFKGDQHTIGGYFSYADKDDEVCIFFSNDETPLVLGTMRFPEKEKAGYDLTKRAFTGTENEIYQLRKKAFEEIDKDTAFFRSYNNTNLNLVPLIENNERKVYVLTGTSTLNTVVFGNDYLLSFDKENTLVTKTKFHKGLIPINYEEKDGKKTVGAMHNHLPGSSEFMTATDICTVMLYAKLAKWEKHMVVSEHYMSVFNCESNILTIIPTGR